MLQCVHTPVGPSGHHVIEPWLNTGVGPTESTTSTSAAISSARTAAFRISHTVSAYHQQQRPADQCGLFGAAGRERVQLRRVAPQLQVRIHRVRLQIRGVVGDVERDALERHRSEELEGQRVGQQRPGRKDRDARALEEGHGLVPGLLRLHEDVGQQEQHDAHRRQEQQLLADEHLRRDQHAENDSVAQPPFRLAQPHHPGQDQRHQPLPGQVRVRQRVGHHRRREAQEQAADERRGLGADHVPAQEPAPGGRGGREVEGGEQGEGDRRAEQRGIGVSTAAGPMICGFAAMFIPSGAFSAWVNSGFWN